MARGKGGEALVAFATLDDGSIIEISAINRTWSRVPDGPHLENRKWNLDQLKVPYIDWFEIDPNPVHEVTGFGTEVPW